VTRLRRALLATSLLVAACSGDDGETADRPQPTATSPEPEPEPGEQASSSTATTAASGTSGTTAPPVRFEDAVVRVTQVAEVESPTAMATRAGAGGLVFVAERAGRVRVLSGDEVRPEPLVDISGDVSTGGERGLLGLAFSPDGDRLYLSYTDPAGDTRIDEVLMEGDAADLATRRQVLGVDQPASNHNGGDIRFGPDGFLYVALGDGGGAGDPRNHGQDTSTLLGSLLRIDPINRAATEPYAIPAGNPFVGRPPSRAEIYAYGLRNPWRFSFDRSTGDLWIADVGQGTREEIDLLPAGRGAGANLGWNLVEGTATYRGDPPPGAVPPVHEYGREAGACAVTGGFVYRGTAIAGLHGAYVFSDYCDNRLRAIAVDGGRVVGERDLGIEVPRVVSFGEDGAGELWALSLSGGVFRLTA
jgi:glucose/arabinose dehydrogenase